MAQMPQGKSEEFASHFVERAGPGSPAHPMFDLIISKAEEQHATPSEFLRVARTGFGRSPNLVPRPISGASGDLQIPLSAVTIVRENAREEYCNSAAWDNNDVCPGATAVAAALPRTGLVSSSKRDFSWLLPLLSASTSLPHCRPPQTKDDPREQFRKCVLESMLVRGHGDLALLQKRDFYFPEYEPQFTFTGSNKQPVIDRILWKHDLLAEADLTGAQIKSLLKTSDEVENQESNPTSIQDTTERGLIHSGLLFSKRKDYYINADNLDDSQVYKVVTSDYLVLSDTGYTEIAKPAISDDNPVFKRKTASLISGLTCSSLHGTPCNLLLPESEHIVSATPTYLPLHKARKNMFSDLESWFAAIRSGGPYDKNLSEERLEARKYTEVTVDNLSVGYTLHSPYISDPEIARDFTGVSQSQASQLHSSELQAKGKVRVLWRNRSVPIPGPFNLSWDFGVEPRADYDRSRQGNVSTDTAGNITSSPDSVTFPKNNFTVGPVFQVHRHVFQPHWMFAFRPLEFGVELSENRFRLQGLPDPIRQTRVKTLTNKVGMRYEKDAKTYLEIGMQHGQNSDVLKALIVNPGTPDAHMCGLDDPQSTLQSCAANFLKPSTSPPMQELATFHTSGMYWDGQATVPLPIPTLQPKYVVVLKGDLFANRSRSRGRIDNETASQTRYDVTFSHGFKFPIYGSFSLQPTFEWFYYENKIFESFLKKRNFDIEVSYDFSRKSRVSVLKRMKYDSTAGSP